MRRPTPIPRPGTSRRWAKAVEAELNIAPPLADWAKEEGITDEILRERLEKASDEAYSARVEKNGASLMRYVEKQIFLQSLDHLWREHLVTLDHLRQVIGWRGLAQRDPLNEYKSEAFELFGELITQLRETTTAQLNHVEIAYEAPPLQAQSFDSLTPPPANFMEALTPPAAAMPPPAQRPSRCNRRRSEVRRRSSGCRPILRPGARSAATSSARAARARNTSTATARSASKQTAHDTNPHPEEAKGRLEGLRVCAYGRETILRPLEARIFSHGLQMLAPQGEDRGASRGVTAAFDLRRNHPRGT